MACLTQLKEDVRFLEGCFTKHHERFQIVSASVDELTCKFIGENGRKFIVIGNFTETYPISPPIWFTADEDPTISTAIECLISEDKSTFHVCHQIYLLCKKLCALHRVSEPAELATIGEYLSSEGLAFAASDKGDYDSGKRKEFDDETEQESDFETEESDEEMDEGLGDGMKEEVNPEQEREQAMLQKVVQRQIRHQLETGSVQGSVQATDRLMKDLKDIYKSDSYKERVYDMDVVDDNLYHWNIKLKKVDRDSKLHEDLAKYRAKTGKDHVLLSFTFEDTFPFTPPFVRLVSPVLKGLFLMPSGAICMELLTNQGWSSAYNLESVILQIASTLTNGGAKIEFDKDPQSQYSLSDAQVEFEGISRTHEESGWYTPPKNKG